MSQEFNKTFKIVTGIHVGIVALAVFYGGINRLLEPKPELVTPVEFFVDVTPMMPDGVDMFQDIAELEPEPMPEIPEPVVIPEKVTPPKLTPVRKKKIIKVSRKKVTRSNKPKTPKKPTLTEAEIRKLLAAGATRSDHTSIPDEDSRCFALIKDTLHAVWDQPSAEAAGHDVAVLKISLERDGRIRGMTLHQKSGNAALDNSVQQVAKHVQRIHGLTPDFIKRHSSMTVSFSVD
jgi:hypothetical protein